MMFSRALFALLAYDVVNAFCPFKRIYSTIRSWEVANKVVAQDTIDRVCLAVNYACAWYPKRALCFQRSFATTYLLKRYGVSAQMVLGVQKFPFKAHAWVEVENRVINERTDVYAVYAVWDKC
jgi:hypothetical protein